MKVISIWQPYSSLIMARRKFFETRTWAPPAAYVGQRIGIASTKTVTADQLGAFEEPAFQRWFGQSELPHFNDLPKGYLLGTVLLHSVEEITEEFLDDITDEEKAYGWFDRGGYAWRLRDPQPLAHPIPIRGAQGFYDYKGLDHVAVSGEGEGWPAQQS